MSAPGPWFRRIAVNGQPEFLVNMTGSPAITADCQSEVPPMSRTSTLSIAALAGLALAVAAGSASAQGRSGGAPGWGHGQSSGSIFETPFGPPSGGETRSHTTGGGSDGTWGRRGNTAETFNTPSGTHTVGKYKAKKNKNK